MNERIILTQSEHYVAIYGGESINPLISGQICIYEKRENGQRFQFPEFRLAEMIDLLLNYKVLRRWEDSKTSTSTPQPSATSDQPKS